MISSPTVRVEEIDGCSSDGGRARPADDFRGIHGSDPESCGRAHRLNIEGHRSKTYGSAAFMLLPPPASTTSTAFAHALTVYALLNSSSCYSNLLFCSHWPISRRGSGGELSRGGTGTEGRARPRGKVEGGAVNGSAQTAVHAFYVFHSHAARVVCTRSRHNLSVSLGPVPGPVPVSQTRVSR